MNLWSRRRWLFGLAGWLVSGSFSAYAQSKPSGAPITVYASPG
jgi:hypothetical protein